MTPQPDWRSVFALLANEQTAYALAAVILTARTRTALPPDLDKRALPRLARASLITETDTGYVLNVAGLADKLGQQNAGHAQHEGLARFVRGGRIVNYPAGNADRQQLLNWVAHEVLAPGETIDEAMINDRLRPFMDEFALLRRYLIDYRAVERTNDGSSYWLAETTAQESNDNESAPVSPITT
jgi:hypothetical protein